MTKEVAVKLIKQVEANRLNHLEVRKHIEEELVPQIDAMMEGAVNAVLDGVQIKFDAMAAHQTMLERSPLVRFSIWLQRQIEKVWPVENSTEETPDSTIGANTNKPIPPANEPKPESPEF